MPAGWESSRKSSGERSMMLLISNDPLTPRRRLADPATPPAPGPAYLADAGHLIVRRDGLMDVGAGRIALDDVEATECFRLWDDAETVSSRNPFQGRKREMPERPNQRRFRERLMRDYHGRCAVTGCDIPELLDAAHLIPWRIGDEGILLRVDLHRMLDRGVAEIRNGRFRLLKQVLDYEKYDGVKLRKPKGRAGRERAGR